MRSFFNKSLHSLSSKSIRVSGSTYLTTSLLTLVGRKKSPLNTPLLENVATLNPVFFLRLNIIHFLLRLFYICRVFWKRSRGNEPNVKYQPTTDYCSTEGTVGSIQCSQRWLQSSSCSINPAEAKYSLMLDGNERQISSSIIYQRMFVKFLQRKK